MKVGFFLSHPIQYYSPLFRRLARSVDLHVHYFVRQDPAGQAAAGFGVKFDWDVPLLDGYRYTFLDNRAKRPTVGSLFGANTPAVRELCERERFDAAVLVGWNRLSSWQTIAACRRSGTPLLIRGDSVIHPDRWLWRKVKYLPYRVVLPRLDGFLYVGQRNREYLRHYGVPEDKLYFVPHCVDDVWFRQRAEAARKADARAEIRARCGIPPEAVVALYCGKLTPRKRPQDVVAAFAALSGRPAARDSHLLVVGDGPMRAELEAQAGERVHFAGFQNQTALPAYYTAADFLVVPSGPRETWALVVNEAMACGLPAVLTDIVGCGPDLIEPGKTGLIFPMGDVPALADAALKMAQILTKDRDAVASSVASRLAAFSIEAATTTLGNALVDVARKRRHE